VPAAGRRHLAPEVLGRARARGIALDFIEPGTPVGNAYVASFHGKLRDECLYERCFTELADAPRTAGLLAWRAR
jgi:transposase InsO family protein